jgi:Sap, sulfolipid-1-addressing protein
VLQTLPLAVASAVDPALIAAVAIMLSRRQAARLLVAYLVGGFGVSVGVGVVILFVLGGPALGGDSGNLESPAGDIGAGLVLLAIAVVVATGAGARLAAVVKARGRSHAHANSSDASNEAKRPSLLDRARAADSPWMAWLAGVAWGTPGAFYLAALALIATSRDSLAGRIVTILVFNLVMFALVEVPLVAFLVAPDLTRARIQRSTEWTSAHRRVVVALVVGTLAVYALVKGLSRV